MLWLYNTALAPLRLVAEVWASRPRRDAAKRLEWAERLGRRVPLVAPGGVWLHGSSVGEARLVTLLCAPLKSLEPQPPLAVSAFTAGGRRALPEPPAVDAAFFAPLDFPGLASRLIAALAPRALVLIETELWPNLLAAAGAARLPVVIVNARLSPRRMRRYRRLAPLYRPLLGRVTAIGAQSEADAERFLELGATSAVLSVTGNLKYDLPPAAVDPRVTREALGLSPERALFVAGSTAPDEEGAVLDAFLAARRARPELLLVLAPRHLSRREEVARLVGARGLALARLSERRPIGREVEALLVDTLGELPALYALARVAFVGGSLVPRGGHNLLEPAACGVPVLFGPYTEHFAAPAAELKRAGGGREVEGGRELARALAELLEHDELCERMGRHARAVVETHRGALDRTIELLRGPLALRTGASSPGAA